eukprot:scaffold30.g4428.t1
MPAAHLLPSVRLTFVPGQEAVDLYGYLLRNRIIFLNQRVNDQVATQVVASLLALDSLDSEEEIKLYVNCAAGSPYAVVSILDTMRAVAAPVSTVAFGLVGGAATTILASGAKGRRFSMPSTRIVLQQPMSGLQGSADEVNIQAKEANRNMRILYRRAVQHEEADGRTAEHRAWRRAARHRPPRPSPPRCRPWRRHNALPCRLSRARHWPPRRFLAEATGLSVERVEEECDRENFLSPAAAVELGLIDGVIEQP